MGSRRDLLASLGPAVEHAFVPAGHEGPAQVVGSL